MGLKERELLAKWGEAAIIAVFFALILFLGVSASSGHSINHPNPVGYGASDGFQHLARAEAIKEMGQYKNEISYMVAGQNNVIGFYPPIVYHVTALFSESTGLESYDALMFMIGLSIALGTAAVYFLTRKLSVAAAILAMPLTLYMTTGRFFLGVTFGQLPFIFSSMFLVAAGYAAAKHMTKGSFFLAGLFLAATIMTHTAEFIFYSIFFFIAVFASTVIQAFEIKPNISGITNGFKGLVSDHKGLLMTGIVTAVLTSYFLPIFYGVWLKIQPYKFGVEKISASFPAATVSLTDFGFMLPAVILGIFVSLLLIVQKRKQLRTIVKSPVLMVIGFSLIMLLAGFGNYAGFGLRSFQARFYWPITLAPLAGLALYQIVKIGIGMSGKQKKELLYAASVSVAAISVIAFLAVSYSSPSPGMNSIYHWEPMQWIADNSDSDDRIHVLYSDYYTQTSTLYGTKRVSYYIDINDYVQHLQQGQLRNDFMAMTASDSGGGLPYRKGLFEFGQKGVELNLTQRFDLCSSNYVIVDKVSRSEGLAQANQAFMNVLLNNNMTTTFENQFVSVLKNNNVGGDCIA
jgi:hypothetical protein